MTRLFISILLAIVVQSSGLANAKDKANATSGQTVSSGKSGRVAPQGSSSKKLDSLQKPVEKEQKAKQESRD